MINLIPPAARRSIVREYWLRVVSVWLFLFGTGCLIVTVLLLPTYVLIHAQVATLSAQVVATSEKTATFDVSAAELIEASRLAALLSTTASTTHFSESLTALEQLAGAGITIRDVSFTRTGGNGEFTIAGGATTRQNLATFRDALEAHPAFATVDLPISALIKDRDLLFSMKVTFASSTTLTTP